MGTWSISPDTGLASIDQNGKLTYQEHTEDKVYTIKYEDDTCGTITKDITIKKCEGPTPPPTGIRIYVEVTSQDLSKRGKKVTEIILTVTDMGMLTLTPIDMTVLGDGENFDIAEEYNGKEFTHVTVKLEGSGGGQAALFDPDNNTIVNNGGYEFRLDRN